MIIRPAIASADAAIDGSEISIDEKTAAVIRIQQQQRKEWEDRGGAIHRYDDPSSTPEPAGGTGQHSDEREWTPDENGDFGKYPSNYVAIVKKWFSENLRDPDSAKYQRISRPRKEHAIVNMRDREAIYGWSVCATVNAKNGFGGYTGAETTWFLIRDGEIQREQPVDEGAEIYIGRPINCDDGK